MDTFTKKKKVKVDPEDPSHILGDLDWHCYNYYNGKIKVLPDRIGDLRIDGKFDLSGNGLRTLPDSIVNIECEMLDLSGNGLTELPAAAANPTAFRGIKTGHLDLGDNALRSLPESIKGLDQVFLGAHDPRDWHGDGGNDVEGLMTPLWPPRAKGGQRLNEVCKHFVPGDRHSCPWGDKCWRLHPGDEEARKQRREDRYMDYEAAVYESIWEHYQY